MLKVKAVEGVLVADVDAAMNNVRRFVGRSQKHPWAVLAEPVMVRDCVEYQQAIANGELELVE